ncbi:ROK family protein [Bacillus sp. B1-b2]|uniref:ROK family protein n=1 Tax=Bacillus sp. B1-b2 TaxID=2653201 RepID=UPI00126211BB|nr:ROK family protein [Bacillus sp. B1-b2]KAB7672168.1 ROK family protein [Bacillus sp. B1-b2]
MNSFIRNTSQLKRMNIELVKNVLKTQGISTKAGIAKQAQLSVATCGTILNELVANGEVLEKEPEESSGGRPAIKYEYNANYGFIINLIVRVEVETFTMQYNVVNLVGEVITEVKQEVESITVDEIDRLIETIIEEYNNVCVIGIGIPGVVNAGVIGVCDISELIGINLGFYLEEKYNVLVTVENDMNITGYGFYHEQEYEEEKTFAIVTFPKNHFPGASFIVDGLILSGNTKFGGEISFLPFGVKRETQLKQLNTEEGFIQLAIKTLTSIIAIINPVTIVITGELPKEEQINQLYTGCLEYIPKEHMPNLLIQNDTQNEYLAGLATFSLERFKDAALKLS